MMAGLNTDSLDGQYEFGRCSFTQGMNFNRITCAEICNKGCILIPHTFSNNYSNLL